MTVIKEIPVVAALSVRDGRVFLARRGAHKPSAGLWELPGGKVEQGEAPAAALARELKEELFLDTVVESIPYDDSRREAGGRRFRFLVFRTGWEGVPSGSTDHDRWGYFLPAEIPFGELAPLDEKVLLRWARESMSPPSRRCLESYAP